MISDWPSIDSWRLRFWPPGRPQLGSWSWWGTSSWPRPLDTMDTTEWWLWLPETAGHHARAPAQAWKEVGQFDCVTSTRGKSLDVFAPKDSRGMIQNNWVPLPSSVVFTNMYGRFYKYIAPPLRRGNTMLLHREARKANMKRAHSRLSLCLSSTQTHFAEWKFAAGEAEGIL